MYVYGANIMFGVPGWLVAVTWVLLSEDKDNQISVRCANQCYNCEAFIEHKLCSRPHQGADLCA